MSGLHVLDRLRTRQRIVQAGEKVLCREMQTPLNMMEVLFCIEVRYSAQSTTEGNFPLAGLRIAAARIQSMSVTTLSLALAPPDTTARRRTLPVNPSHCAPGSAPAPLCCPDPGFPVHISSSHHCSSHFVVRILTNRFQLTRPTAHSSV